jgi:hypothetical protein
MAIRRWFEKQLITRDRLRMQTLAGPETRQAHPMAVLDALQEARPIRSDPQGDSTRWELSHDTLISAVLDHNRKWLRGRLQPWQLAARAWAEDRQRARLLTGHDLRAAQRSAGRSELTEDERRFLVESERVDKDRGALVRVRGALTGLRLVVILETALIVLLVLLLAR